MPRVAAQSRTNGNQNRKERILQDQKKAAQVIANQKRRAQTENKSSKRAKSTIGSTLEFGGKQRGSKGSSSAIADDDSEEFEWKE